MTPDWRTGSGPNDSGKAPVVPGEPLLTQGLDGRGELQTGVKGDLKTQLAPGCRSCFPALREQVGLRTNGVVALHLLITTL